MKTNGDKLYRIVAWVAVTAFVVFILFIRR
jgi:hypothetical protein